MLAPGGAAIGKALRDKYDDQTTDAAFQALADHWAEKLAQLQVKTPDADMDTSLNLWNLYQSQVNVTFSRFASFIEVGGRTGLATVIPRRTRCAYPTRTRPCVACDWSSCCTDR